MNAPSASLHRATGGLEFGTPSATSEPPHKSNPSATARRFLWPREHGAWGMVLLPFLSAWVLARGGGWPVIAALAAVLATFLIREPVLVLLRQRYRWSQPRAETSAARRTLTLLAPVLALSGVILTLSTPIHSLMVLGGLAAIVMTFYLWGAMTNRQRSSWLQAAGAVGLSASAPLAYLAAGRDIDQVALLLWAAHSVHGIASVLVIHARLDAISAHRRGNPNPSTFLACRTAQTGAALFAATLAISGFPMLGAATAFPVLVHTLALRRLSDPDFLKIKLQKVGFRELAISVLFSAASVAGLW